jgi:flavorubredoxin
VQRIDFVVSNHAEQDHSGAIPFVLEKHPEAIVLATPKGKEMLVDHLLIPPERVQAVADGENLELGGKTLRFIHAPWQHWPETMMSYLAEDRILFPCDLFGAHLASTDLFANDGCIDGPVKSYYAEIMMPFAKVIQKNLGKLAALDMAIIAPSHGPIHLNPAEILGAYNAWIGGPPKNLALVLHVTMHGSTRELVERFLVALGANGVSQQACDLTMADLGQIATALVDAATLVVATPTVLGGARSKP